MVVAIATVECVVAIAAVGAVLSGAAEYDVIAVATGNDVVTLAPGDDVISAQPVDCVLSAKTDDAVIACCPIDYVVVAGAHDDVRTHWAARRVVLQHHGYRLVCRGCVACRVTSRPGDDSLAHVERWRCIIGHGYGPSAAIRSGGLPNVRCRTS